MVNFYIKVMQRKKAELEKELELVQEKIAQVDEDLEKAQKIKAFQEYIKTHKNSGLDQDKIKKFILDLAPSDS